MSSPAPVSVSCDSFLCLPVCTSVVTVFGNNCLCIAICSCSTLCLFPIHIVLCEARQLIYFSYLTPKHIYAGVGIISSGVRNESDPALALLTDFIESPTASTNLKTASALGLGTYCCVLCVECICCVMCVSWFHHMFSASDCT